ncbi:MAG TPA: hypothetical protein VHS78_04675, partial [Candidatus Elarobacter sp.]|nr:hypothetical protein [Candidatus Elarobacter sp.]
STDRLAKLPRRVIYRASALAAVPSARQDVVASGHIDRSAARVPSYCATHRLQIERVQGDVTSEGKLTVTGVCFGASGTGVRLDGDLPGGAVDLQVVSWADETVVALLPKMRGLTDRPVRLRLLAPQFAVSSSQRYGSVSMSSAPVALTFVAKRVTQPITGKSLINVSCAKGPAPDDRDGCGYCPWQFTADPQGCASGGHVRGAAPTSGTDEWAVRLPPAWHIEQITAGMDNAEIETDPSMAASSATFRIRWRSVPVGEGKYLYQDGGYWFTVLATGPDGTLP